MTTDVNSLFEQDAQALMAADDDLLSVAEMAQRAKAIEKELADLEKTVEEKKAALRKITEEALPARFQELGMTSFDMVDGSKITIKPFYNASIREETRGRAFEWLREQGYDDIIKNQVSVRFGRKEDGLCDGLVANLREQGYPVEHTQKVEPQTLKAWAKEMVERGRPLPADLFGLYVGQRAVIKSA